MIQIKFRHTFERIKSQLSPAQLPLVVFRGINEHTHKQIERAKRSRGQTETQKLIKKKCRKLVLQWLRRHWGIYTIVDFHVERDNEFSFIDFYRGSEA